MKIMLYAFLALLLMSGCVRRVRHIPIENTVVEETVPETTPTPKPTGKLYDTSKTESKYNLKPEPYSVGSKEKDPELLGPQRTVAIQEVNVEEKIEVTATTEDIQNKVQNTETVVAPSIENNMPNVTTTMNRSECISMIGSEKFERYSKRFGGETGALKRCAILKKLKG